ncbi:MAG: hypothetical protein OXI24_10140 [Candidatus Poribacteria bacterium]|nr:hypothetical protein [Candidatus Poribacteria bacterium]
MKHYTVYRLDGFVIEYETLSRSWLDAAGKFVQDRINAGLIDWSKSLKRCKPDQGEYEVREQREGYADTSDCRFGYELKSRDPGS